MSRSEEFREENLQSQEGISLSSLAPEVEISQASSDDNIKLESKVSNTRESNEGGEIVNNDLTSSVDPENGYHFNNDVIETSQSENNKLKDAGGDNDDDDEEDVNETNRGSFFKGLQRVDRDFTQLRGCLTRIAIEKKRSIRGTCCEFFSHLIIMLILVAGFYLSNPESFDNIDFSSINVYIPPNMKINRGLNQNFTITNREEYMNSFELEPVELYRSLNRYLQGPVIIPNLDEYVTIGSALKPLTESYNFLNYNSIGRSIEQMVNLGDIHFSPNTPEVHSLIDYFNKTYFTFNSNFTLFVHESEDIAVKSILKSKRNTFALIDLKEVSLSKVNYLIRQNYTVLPNSNEIITFPSPGTDYSFRQYFFSGFLSLQKGINEWIFHHNNITSQSTIYDDSELGSSCLRGAPSATYITFPQTEYDLNPFYSSVGFLLGLAMIMSTMFPMSKLTKSIVEEKETKMRELMKIMGLKDWVHHLSWFISSFILFFWIAITCTIITTGSFLTHSNSFLIFLLFFFYTLSEISFSFLLSVFFSNSKLAAIAAPVLLFGSILPRYIFYSTNPQEQVVEKIWSCLLSSTAFAFAADIISDYEYGNVGIQIWNMNKGDFNFGICLAMIIVDFFLYLILAWYFDQIYPQEYGSQKHPLFIFNYKYWFGIRSKIGNFEVDFNSMPEFEGSHLSEAMQVIPKDEEINAKIRLKNLTKRYDNGFVAVKSVSFSMMENQITCLLGHNGAGKSTTINTLTGLITASGGDASIYNYSLHNNLEEIRNITGLCPQQNVIFSNLTVEEHLNFFGNLKGLKGKKLKKNINKILYEIGLEEKKYTQAHALSGGMKRKLCLGMALIGDPKFVLLDEPTSGMDPYSRRSTWELLQKCKKNRTILLTTHFMDEADTLSDRIAILSKGTILCSGSSLFLKSKFGNGYLLNISRNKEGKSIDLLNETVQSIIPSAKLSSAIAGEAIYQLPLESTKDFGNLFRSIQNNSSDLSITSYGISITTLEQVFISLAHATVEKVELLSDSTTKRKEINDTDMKFNLFSVIDDYIRIFLEYLQFALGGFLFPIISRSESLYNYHLNLIESRDIENNSSETKIKDKENSDVIFVPKTYIQIFELYRKRLIIASRDIKGFIFQIFLPALVIFLIMIILTIKPNISGNTIILSVDMFGRLGDTVPTVLFSDKNSTDALTSLMYQTISSMYKPGSVNNRVNLIETDEIENKNLYSKKNYDSLDMKHFKLDSAQDKLDWFNRKLKSFETQYLNLHNYTETSLMHNIFKNFGSSREDVDKKIINPMTSHELSRLIIHNNDIGYENPTQDQYAAYILDDEIYVNIYVDNDWLKLYYQSYTPIVIPIFTNLFLGDKTSVTYTLTELNDFYNMFAIDDVTFLDLLYLLFPIDVALDMNNSKLQFTHEGIIIMTEFIGIPINLPIVTYESVIQNFIESLPEGYNSQVFNIDSPITILHNTSTMHSVPVWEGELAGSLYESCIKSSSLGENINKDSDILFYGKNHPLPISEEENMEVQVILSLLTSIFILVPLCYIPAAFIAFLVKERVSKSKHLQIVSGLSPFLYWLATFLWDLTLFIILIGFILIAIYIFSKDAGNIFLGNASAALYLVVSLFLYGSSSLPLSYLYSLFFSNFATAQVSIMVINFMTGFVFVLARYIMINVPSTKSAEMVLRHIFRIFPSYNIGESLITISTVHYENLINEKGLNIFSYEVGGKYLFFMGLETFCYFFAVLLTETELAESVNKLMLDLQGGFQLSKEELKKEAERVIDDDVKIEEETTKKWTEKFNSNDLTDIDSESFPVLVINQLRKTYPASSLQKISNLFSFFSFKKSKVTDDEIDTEKQSKKDSKEALTKPKRAVKGMSLALGNGERFGLLGINGAGKTTTLGVLTREIKLTSGSIFVSGKGFADNNEDIEEKNYSSLERIYIIFKNFFKEIFTIIFHLKKKDQKGEMDMIGYCPQVDPIFDLLNAYETLWFFGKIRGVPDKYLAPRIVDIIDQISLPPYMAKRVSGTYSGGNKRKLSLGIALIGDPQVLLLDEPSTGMDPEARRHMWTLIEEITSSKPNHSSNNITGRTLILVSHSMEEVEALCTRVAVMVSGRVQCIGSSQHLKSRFGTGYLIELRCYLGDIEPCLADCLELLKDSVKDGNGESFLEIEEKLGSYFRLKASQNLDLGTTFDVLEQMKKKYNIYDYSVSQCSLEQVFLKFAQNQDEEKKKKFIN